MPITKNDWMNKLVAQPVLNQKNIRIMFAMINIPQISIENEPTDFVSEISLYWE